MKFLKLSIVFILVLFQLALLSVKPDRLVEIAVVIPSYKNEKYIVENLDSVLKQKYPKFEIIYVDDNSPDKTGQMADEYVRKYNLQGKMRVIHNTQRKGALQNLYDTIHTIDDHKVVVCVDGDDTLISDLVLERIAQEYKNGQIWMTYGQYLNYPMCTLGICAEIPRKVSLNNAFRKHTFVASHPRTFYAGLFKKIKKEDLMHEGSFFAMAWDLAMMFPMLEMSAYDHFKFIDTPLYKYNHENPINDYKVNYPLLARLENIIRKREPYKPLDALF